MLLITQNTIYSTLSSEVAQAQANSQKAQRRATSGLRVEDAADDPVAAARGSLIGASLATLDSMDRVSRLAGSKLEASELTINQAMDVLARAQELTVAAANGSYNAQQRGFVAEEMAVLHETMVALANTQQGGSYLFGGYTAGAPFADDGTYNGDDGVRQLDVAPGLRVAVNLPGSQVFAVSGGTNIIAVLADLTASLHADDVPGSLAALDRITASNDQLNQARTQVSASVAQIDAGARKRADLLTTLRKDRSNALEIDQAEALVKLTEAETAYQTAITSAARVIGQMRDNPLWR